MLVVTGGAGFIGSNLVAALEERGLGPVCVCDYLGNGDKWRNIAKRDIDHLIGPDVLLEFLEDHRGEIDAIFHMGAISATTETDVDLLVKTNVRLPLDLWNFCVENETRLIYASSAATYGDGAQGFDDDGTSDGLRHLQPLNPYGWSKHRFDQRVAAKVEANAARPPQWAGLKFFNVYGPNEYHKEGQTSVVYQIYRQLAAGGQARLFKSHHPDYEDGGQLRDFVWVDDCSAVMLWLYDNPGVNGLFNCGTGAARSFADLAKAVYAAMGLEPAIEFVDTPIEIRDRYQYFTQAETKRLRAAGFDASFTALEDGVTAYVRKFLATPDPYR